MNEVWKDVVGYEGYYEVSDLGNVRKNKCGTILKLSMGTKYKLVGFYVNQKLKTPMVHRLVATAFIDNPENKEQVNHINGIKTDNRASNLEWVTLQENIAHSVRTGLLAGVRGENHHNCKISEEAARDIKFNYVKGVTSLKYFAAKHNTTIQNVCFIANNKAWKWLTK